MLRKVLKRILISIPVLVGVVLLIFIMLRIVPGDPVTTMMGEHVNPAVIEKISKEMGLDKPLYCAVFAVYCPWRFGGISEHPYRLNRNVTKIILEAFPNTVKLSLLAAVVAGSLVLWQASLRQCGRISCWTACLWVVPDRCFHAGLYDALVLQYLFAFKFKWFPVSGFDSFRAMILPAIVLGWNSAGSIARMTRSTWLRSCRMTLSAQRGLRVCWSLVSL